MNSILYLVWIWPWSPCRQTLRFSPVPWSRVGAYSLRMVPTLIKSKSPLVIFSDGWYSFHHDLMKDREGKHPRAAPPRPHSSWHCTYASGSWRRWAFETELSFGLPHILLELLQIIHILGKNILNANVYQPSRDKVNSDTSSTYSR